MLEYVFASSSMVSESLTTVESTGSGPVLAHLLQHKWFL